MHSQSPATGSNGHLAESNRHPERLADFQERFVQTFSDLADLFGNPRSHGAIFGLLFASPTPMSMDAITAALEISSGSASQGLRQLESFGAVQRERLPDGRGHLYSARTELRPLIQGFLQERVFPRLKATSDQIAELREMAAGLPPDFQSHARARIDRLGKWHGRAKTLVPLAEKMLGLG